MPEPRLCGLPALAARARAHILERLESTNALSVPASSLRSTLLDDRGGDALDSVIGALATLRAFCGPDLLAVGHESLYAVEGYIYV